MGSEFVGAAHFDLFLCEVLIWGCLVKLKCDNLKWRALQSVIPQLNFSVNTKHASRPVMPLQSK